MCICTIRPFLVTSCLQRCCILFCSPPCVFPGNVPKPRFRTKRECSLLALLSPRRSRPHITSSSAKLVKSIGREAFILLIDKPASSVPNRNWTSRGGLIKVERRASVSALHTVSSVDWLASGLLDSLENEAAGREC